MDLSGSAQPPSSPLLCSCSKWMMRHRVSWLLLLIHYLHDLDEIPDPKSFSLNSCQHFTSSSSKWLHPLQQQGQCPHSPRQCHPHLPGFSPVFWEEPRRALWGNTSAIFPLPDWQKHTGNLGLSNVTCPPHRQHTFLCERAQPRSSKIFQRWQGRTFWGPCCVPLYELLGSRWSEEKLSMGSLWLHRLLKHWAYLTQGWMW